MNPDKSSPNGGMRDLQAQPIGGASSDGVSDNSPVATQTPEDIRTQQAAAANVIRSQISGMYRGEAAVSPEPQGPAPVAYEQEGTNPYHRTHTPHPQPQAEQWKEYHSAWQNYYQKYYENYYTAQAARVPATTIPQKMTTAADDKGYFSSQPVEAEQAPETVETLSNDQALYELRQKLLGKVQDSAHKIRKSRHFIPILSAVLVVLLFVFVQYNQVFIANVKAYVSPGSIDPQNIVVDPTTDVVVSQESRLIIPKINVDVPVTYDVGTDNASQMAAMANGLAHFPIPGANSHPGEVGNTVIAGHSSNDLFDGGDYKFIFAQLEKLSVGDTIYANYNSKRYTYVVTRTEVVRPTEVNKLVYPTTKPVITLITCTPLGTSLNRLLVTADQVSPDPTVAAAAPAGSGTATSGTTSAIPGNNGTLLDKLFGGGK